ncbi:hypothetical protein SADUNF_Sadunf13G0108000 [Salix dunnii]|uniref:Uncharacterized protein n=1 Tax=Salix dunnii TaxID=1413687 RepID=A0A835JHF5_9ROSI|nr:hypothetical protein SADUNF_Sadunf13G0108000 [Salix dunnii]
MKTSKRRKVGQPIWQSFLKILSIEMEYSQDSRDPLKLGCWNDFATPAGKASNSSEKAPTFNSLSWSFVMDFGNALIAVFETSRYLKCLSLQIESGNSMIPDDRNLRVLKLLNLRGRLNTSTIEKTVHPSNHPTYHGLHSTHHQEQEEIFSSKSFTGLSVTGLVAASWSTAWIMVKDSSSFRSCPFNPQASLIPSAAMELTLVKVSCMANLAASSTNNHVQTWHAEAKTRTFPSYPVCPDPSKPVNVANNFKKLFSFEVYQYSLDTYNGIRK